MNLTVELFDLAHARDVDRYVLEHPGGTPFHETRWLDLVRTTFDYPTMTLVAWRGERVEGVLPLAMVQAPVTGRRLVSVPYGVYGGILADGPEAIGALDQAARQLAAEEHVRNLETRYLEQGPTPHPGVELYETYRKALPEDPDEVLASIPRKARAEVRKARNRLGVTLTQGQDLFDEFYRLYCRNKRGLGSPVFQRSYFRRLLELFGYRAVLHGLLRDGEVVAAVLSLIQNDTIYPYYSGAVDDAGRMGVNNALYAGLMEDAVERGLATFDFGRSRAGSGPASFKRHMGFEPTPLDYQFFFPHGGKPPSITPSNPKMALPRLVLSRLPMWLARAVGPSIMRHVP